MKVNSLFEVSILELLMLWSELVEAYHGVNGYGSDTAEIYSYRFQQYSPVAHSGIDTDTAISRQKELWSSAGQAFVNLVNLFCDQFCCQVEVDCTDWKTWCHELADGQRTFAHRVHVRVIH